MSAITIGEEILLLALDDDTGRLNVALRDRRIGVAFGGALLMDLALNDRIDTDLRELFVVSSEPLGEPVLDGALARIAWERERRSTDHWVDVFADDRDAVLRQVAGRLVEGGSRSATDTTGCRSWAGRAAGGRRGMSGGASPGC